jgi:hypothetical protein
MSHSPLSTRRRPLSRTCRAPRLGVEPVVWISVNLVLKTESLVAVVALGVGAAAVAGSVVVVEVEVASETAVGVEVVDEADSEIVEVVEGVEAALTVAASATLLARRSPSKAILNSVRTVCWTLGFYDWHTQHPLQLRRQVLATHAMVILSAYRPGRIVHVYSCKDGTCQERFVLFFSSPRGRSRYVHFPTAR